MEQNGQRAELVNFRDLGWFLLLHWKRVILIALLAGVLLGGFQGIRQAQRAKAAPALESVSETEQDLEPAPGEQGEGAQTYPASPEEKSEYYQRMVRIRRKAADELGAYVDEAPYMQLDPMNVTDGRMVVHIALPKKHEDGAAYELTNGYRTRLLDPSGLRAAADYLGTEPERVLDLFSVLDPLTQDSPDRSLSSFTVRAYGQDTEAVRVILDAVRDELTAAKEELEGQICPHELTIDEAVYRSGGDTDLYTGQLWYESALYIAQNDVINYSDAWKSAEQQEETEAVSDAAAPAPAPAPGRGTILRLAVRWFLTGFAAAAVICLFFLLLRYLFSAKPLTGGMLFAAQPGLTELGAFRKGTAALYKGNTSIDRYLRDRAGLTVCENGEEIFEAVASGLRVVGKQSGSYLIIGSAEASEKEQLCREMQKRMKDSTFRWAEDGADSVGVRSKLDGTDEVILAEKFGRCSFVHLREQQRMLNGFHIPVSGVVLYG